MITIKIKKILILLLSLAFISFPLFAHTQGPPRLYPRPVRELEKVLFSWLIHSDFKVSQTFLATGQIQLTAVSARKKWQIFLKPHSPSATEVQAGYSVDKQADETQLRKLWEHISEYIKAPHVEKLSLNKAIPNAVLSQIESVVCIKAKLEDKDIQLSGFIVHEDSFIICTAHDLKDVHEVTVIPYDDREIKGHLVKVDTYRDLALIRVNSRLYGLISLARGRNLLGMGERLFSIGCPINLGGTIYSGFINGPPRRINDLPMWQVNMKIHPGSSGSPVFDVKGNLVAMVMGRYRGTDSVGFLIPFETIMDFMRER